MPKIIENLESRLVAEAQNQVETSGYSAMTIRSVAKACGVGVGTVYNYFPSKDQLLTAILLRDWNAYITAISAVSEEADSPMPVVKCIYDQLHQYNRQHLSYFTDEAAVTAIAAAFTGFHAVLRSRLAAPLRKFCGSDFEAEFIIEALLTWTTARKSFDEIYGLLAKLL